MEVGCCAGPCYVEGDFVEVAACTAERGGEVALVVGGCEATLDCVRDCVVGHVEGEILAFGYEVGAAVAAAINADLVYNVPLFTLSDGVVLELDCFVSSAVVFEKAEENELPDTVHCFSPTLAQLGASYPTGGFG